MLKVKKYALKDKIYGYPDACGLGDVWAVTSYLLRISEEADLPSRFFTKNIEFRNRIEAIRPFLRSKGQIQFVSQASQRVFNYCEPYKVKFVPTLQKWNGKSNIVAFQFDGNHLYDRKNLPDKRLKFLIKSLTEMGYNSVDVGNHKSISFIVETLANCRLFVGCPSGLSVACLSVGTPIYLITRRLHPDFLQWLRKCHYRTVDVQMFTTVDQFLIRVKQLY